MKYITKEVVQEHDHRVELGGAFETLRQFNIGVTKAQIAQKSAIFKKQPKSRTVYFWHSSDGRKTAFEDLDPSHLVNIIVMIERRAQERLDSFNEYFDKAKGNTRHQAIRLFCKDNIDGFSLLLDLARKHKVYHLLDDPIGRNQMNDARGRDNEGWLKPIRQNFSRSPERITQSFIVEENRRRARKGLKPLEYAYRGQMVGGHILLADYDFMANEGCFDHLEWDSDTAYGVG